MNYEFHVGDYVETAGGAIGYVSFADNRWWRCVLPADGYYSNSDYSIIGLDDDTVPKYFVRIGAYDFTKKEKKTIKKLNLQGYLSTQTVASVVNELVDAMNELRSDYDEHIEAHRQADR